MKSTTFKPIALAAAVAFMWPAGHAAAADTLVSKGAEDNSGRSVPRPTPQPATQGARDLNGVWARYPLPWPTYSGDFDDIPPPDQGPDLEEPYATEWRDKRIKRQEAIRAGKPLLDPSTLCLPEGMPTVMQAIYPIQILQTPGQITVLAEIFSQTRRIYMDAPMLPLDELPPTYYGFSTGHWEENTLVVKTQGIKKEVEFFEIPHSEAMTITERYQLGENGKLYLDISIEDPGYLKTPYEFRWVYERKPDYRIPEYYCDNLHSVVKPDGTVDFNID